MGKMKERLFENSILDESFLEDKTFTITNEDFTISLWEWKDIKTYYPESIDNIRVTAKSGGNYVIDSDLNKISWD